MPLIVENIVSLLVGVALFIAGMSIMSSGLKKVAGKSMKKLFNKIGNNRFASLGIGATVTALIQSSGATSVMAVGFINAGVMTIFQGLCIILGAYLGTTITGLLVSLSSTSISVFMPLTALIGVILTFFKKEKYKNFGEILIGLGILFVGLDLMKGAFGSNSELTPFFQDLFASVSNPLLLLLIGAIFTCITQSSSATTGIVIIMVAQGALDLTNGFYLVLGATIGTVIVTIIATIGGDTNSKRTAVLCLIIRIFTALLATIILWIIESSTNNAISQGLLKLFGGNLSLTVAMFLVFYNIIFIGIIIPFIEPIVKVGCALVKDRTAEEKKKYLTYIDDRLLITPTIALGQAKNEINHMLELARENLKLGFNMLINQDFDKKDELNEREDTIDYINNAITEYLIKLSHEATMKDEKKVGSYFHIINDIERIGDHACNFADGAQEMSDNDVHFSEAAIEELKVMYGVVDHMFEVAQDVFFRHQIGRLGELHTLEDETDKLKTKLTAAHYERVTKETCTAELGAFFTSAVSSLERTADHLVNVGYAYINPTGDDENIKADLKMA
ncbi:MAG: Na/Pi cotransporter family protein [Erysipelotrichaceae bacterium]|nr:Na/Pi cotransporter family protein [Erysipelotrichaceae bacterium]